MSRMSVQAAAQDELGLRRGSTMDNLQEIEDHPCPHCGGSGIDPGSNSTRKACPVCRGSRTDQAHYAAR